MVKIYNKNTVADENTTTSRHSEQSSFCAIYSEQNLDITEHSEHRLNMH
jgi:hypothetical protein